MSRQLIELETVLQMLIDEHRRLLAQADAQQSAMKKLELAAMEDATHRQEASRLRIAGLEDRRRLLVQQIARAARVDNPQDLTLARLSEMFPQNGAKLLKLRDELKSLVKQIAQQTHVAGRLAAAVLGHLNTAVRLFACAVGQAGTYTRNGVPRVTARIGVMEAVG